MKLSPYLEAHQLVGDPLTESTDGDVSDITKEMFNSDLNEQIFLVTCFVVIVIDVVLTLITGNMILRKGMSQERSHESGQNWRSGWCTMAV